MASRADVPLITSVTARVSDTSGSCHPAKYSSRQDLEIFCFVPYFFLSFQKNHYLWEGRQNWGIYYLYNEKIKVVLVLSGNIHENSSNTNRTWFHETGLLKQSSRCFHWLYMRLWSLCSFPKLCCLCLSIGEEGNITIPSS